MIELNMQYTQQQNLNIKYYKTTIEDFLTTFGVENCLCRKYRVRLKLAKRRKRQLINVQLQIVGTYWRRTLSHIDRQEQQIHHIKTSRHLLQSHYLLYYW